MDEAYDASSLESALGSIPDSGHDWDGDPASWVHQQRGSNLAGSGSGSGVSITDVPEHELLEGFGE